MKAVGLHFQDATCVLFDLRRSMPWGVSSILISLVSHPLSGTTALISTLKRKRISWVCVTKMKNSDEPVGIRVSHRFHYVAFAFLCINPFSVLKNKNQYFYMKIDDCFSDISFM